MTVPAPPPATMSMLDASNPSLTISTLGRAARAQGRKIMIELVPV